MLRSLLFSPRSSIKLNKTWRMLRNVKNESLFLVASTWAITALLSTVDCSTPFVHFGIGSTRMRRREPVLPIHPLIGVVVVHIARRLLGSSNQLYSGHCFSVLHTHTHTRPHNCINGRPIAVQVANRRCSSVFMATTSIMV